MPHAVRPVLSPSTPTTSHVPIPCTHSFQRGILLDNLRHSSEPNFLSVRAPGVRLPRTCQRASVRPFLTRSFERFYSRHGIAALLADDDDELVYPRHRAIS